MHKTGNDHRAPQISIYLDILYDVAFHMADAIQKTNEEINKKKIRRNRRLIYRWVGQIMIHEYIYFNGPNDLSRSNLIWMEFNGSPKNSIINMRPFFACRTWVKFMRRCEIASENVGWLNVRQWPIDWHLIWAICLSSWQANKRQDDSR